MIFIIIAFFIGKKINEKKTASQTDFIVYENTFRNLGFNNSAKVNCQLECLGSTDTIIDVILKNGTVINMDKNRKSFALKGRTFKNIPIWVYGHWEQKTNRIDSLQFQNSNQCNCD